MIKGYNKSAKPGAMKKGYMGEPMIADKMPQIISFDEDDLPEIKDWKVGSTYKLEVEVEQTGIHKKNEYESSDEESGMTATFKVKNVKIA